jgi:hypothetical protein
VRPSDDEIDHGIEIQGLYDGVAVWVLKDGTWINRFADMPGYEHRAARIQEWIDEQMQGGDQT